MKLFVHTSGLKSLQAKLKQKAERLLDLKPYWQLVGMYVQKQTTRERFDKEQTPEGSKWKPLAPATVKRRLKRHKTGNMKILQDAGHLRRSIKYEAGSYYVKIGSNLKYARIHQFGGKHIPARPFLGVTPSERRHIKNLLASYLKRHVFNGG